MRDIESLDGTAENQRLTSREPSQNGPDQPKAGQTAPLSAKENFERRPHPIRVLVCGGRDYNDCHRVWTVLGDLHAVTPIAEIIHGGAPGADMWARTWGHSANLPVFEYAADWRRHGRAAGPIRNQQMIDEGKPNLVVAFPGGRGTADMVKRARAAGIEVREVDPSPHRTAFPFAGCSL